MVEETMGAEPIKSEEFLVSVQSPFYPNIADNRLYFHGTSSASNLRSILNSGLAQPSTKSASSDTLARRISFVDFPRYTGGSMGFMLGIEPEGGEINSYSPQFARNKAISGSRLPPERVLFSLPGSSRLASSAFHLTRQALSDYCTHDYDDSLLLTALGNEVSIIESGLRDEATFYREADEIDVHRIAQNLVWNELSGAITNMYDNFDFSMREIARLMATGTISSPDELVNALRRSNPSFVNFNLQTLIHDFHLLSTIQTISGLGFENFMYPLDNQVTSTIEWVKKLLSSQTHDDGDGKVQRRKSLLARLTRHH